MTEDAEHDPHGHVWDGPTVLIHTAELSTCSRCGCDPSDDAAREKCSGSDEEADPDIADVLAAAVEKYPPGPPLHVLRKALAKIRDLRLALRSVRTALTGPVNEGAIADTLWMDLPCPETVVDYIDAALDPVGPSSASDDSLVARLLKFEDGARQQCTCRSDLENCRACDCGLAADVIVAQRKALLRLLARRDTLRTFTPRHSGGMWTATLVEALGAVGASRRPYYLVGIGATEQAAIEHLHSLEAADTWSADGKA